MEKNCFSAAPGSAGTQQEQQQSFLLDDHVLGICIHIAGVLRASRSRCVAWTESVAPRQISR